MVNRVLSKIEAAQGKRDSELPSRQREKAAVEIEIERMRTRPPLENPRVFFAPEEDTVNDEVQTANYIDLIQRSVKGPMPISLEACTGIWVAFRWLDRMKS
jgi:hypothetical protein